MQETRSNVIYILIIVIALGLFFEVLKGFRRSHMTDRKAPTLVLDASLTPFHVSDNEMKAEEIRARARGSRGQTGGMHLAAGPAKVHSYDFSGGKVAAVDPKAQKKKKKKKKKDEGAQKAEVVEQKTVTPLYPETPKTNSDDDFKGAGSHAPVANQPQTPGAVAAGAPAASLLLSYAEWKTKLLASPSKDNVNLLLQYYKNDLVKPTEFYQLLTDMSSTGNSAQQTLALYAANTEPGAASFNFLVSAIKLDTANAAVVTADEQDINEYQALNLVGQLKQVFAGYATDENVTQIAAQVLETSTATFITSRSPTATGGATTTTPAQLTRAYQGFPAILTHMLVIYKANAAVAGLLQQSLTAIQGAGIK